MSSESKMLSSGLVSPIRIDKLLLGGLGEYISITRGRMHRLKKNGGGVIDLPIRYAISINIFDMKVLYSNNPSVTLWCYFMTEYRVGRRFGDYGSCKVAMRLMKIARYHVHND